MEENLFTVRRGSQNGHETDRGEGPPKRGALPTGMPLHQAVSTRQDDRREDCDLVSRRQRVRRLSEPVSAFRE